MLIERRAEPCKPAAFLAVAQLQGAPSSAETQRLLPMPRPSPFDVATIGQPFAQDDRCCRSAGVIDE